MKNLYEILEVSENASQEVIEKAYKVLAKKYHPDVQPENKKEQAEQKMKQLNEAYSILTDKNKKNEYDEKVRRERQDLEQRQQAQYEKQKTNSSAAQNYQTSYAQEMNLRQEAMKKAQEAQIRNRQKNQKQMEKNIQAEYEKRYQQAYEGYLKSLGYKIKYKWTWKNYRNFLFTILIIILIGAALWYFPPTHKLMMDFYESNHVVKTIIDVIISIFVGIGKAITAIFN